jgi:hypothetical protein
VCGGEARATKVATRRRLSTGKNFDLVAGFDLTKAKDRQYGLQYFRISNVLVVIMAPICGPFGPLGYLNQSINPEKHQEALIIATPVAKFCGEVALIQLDKGNSCLVEQPEPTRLYEVAPWPKILKNPRVSKAIYDRCMCGLKTAATSKHASQFIKKPTSITASDPELLKPFLNLRCKGRHQHLDTKQASSALLSKAQVWTWDEADRMIYGSTLLKRAQQRAALNAYPTEINPDDVATPHECPPGVSSERADALAPSNPKRVRMPRLQQKPLETRLHAY